MSAASPPWWSGHLLTVQEVADRLRVSKMTIYRLTKSGALRCVVVGRSQRIPERELIRYLDEGGPPA